ncbi:MAG: hypothetical protein U0237_00790 [Thermoleophilia bacterium]
MASPKDEREHSANLHTVTGALMRMARHELDRFAKTKRLDDLRRCLDLLAECHASAARYATVVTESMDGVPPVERASRVVALARRCMEVRDLIHSVQKRASKELRFDAWARGRLSLMERRMEALFRDGVLADASLHLPRADAYQVLLFRLREVDSLLRADERVKAEEAYDGLQMLWGAAEAYPHLLLRGKGLAISTGAPPPDISLPRLVAGSPLLPAHITLVGRDGFHNLPSLRR